MNRITLLRRGLGIVFCAAILGLSVPESVHSQQQQKDPPLPLPQVFSVSPGGIKAGTTAEVTVTGLHVDAAESLFFNVPGIKAEVLHPVEPMPMPEKDKDKKEKKDKEKKKNNQQKGATTTAHFKVTVPANAPLGLHDVRVVSKWGVSNPRTFVVSDLEEIEEKEPNNDVPQAQKVPLNCAITGMISSPTDVDYYLFEGKQGQRVVVSCLTSSVDSKAMPQLQLYSKAGPLLAMNRDYHQSDAVLDAVLPADGEYYVRVVNFTYTQGGPEHFYRLTISTAPWIDAVFPPMVEPGKETTVTVYGRNLPGGVIDPAVRYETRPLEKLAVKVHPPADAKTLQRLNFSGHVQPRSAGLDGFELRLKNDAGSSNPYLLTYAYAPVVLDNGKNETEATAQDVTLPCEIAGWIEKVRDRDWYRFSVKKGEVYTIEAYGDRLGSPMDLYFTLKQGDKGKAQEFDENPDTLHPTQFFTRTEDPQRYRLRSTEDATYLLQISSREADSQAGPRHLYRLRITPEKPDVRLIVLPPSTNGPDGVVLHKGASQVYSVLAWRQDGFAGDIALSAEGLPPGVTCAPQVIGGAHKQGSLVLTASADAAPWTGVITVKGKARIGDKDVEVEARPADITWSVGNQNVPTVARLSRNLALAVRDGAPFELIASVDKSDVHIGDKVTVTFKLKRHEDCKGPVLVSLINPPPNAAATFGSSNNQPFTLDKDEGTATLDFKTQFPPGTHTFAFRAVASTQIALDAEGKKSPAHVFQAATPITLTVIPKELAKVSVRPETPSVKIGQDSEITVRVARQHDYAGEFTVQLIVPDAVKGISAEEVKIPAGQDEVKLPIKCAAGTPVGGRNGLVIKVTALFNGKVPTVHEAKLSVNVVK